MSAGLPAGPSRRAFLLAGGLGTRLRPLTDMTPKCLLPIAGRPLLAYWVALLERHGFTDVLINLHHLPDQVRAYVAGLDSPLRFTLFDEPSLLGSAGTVRANRAWAGDAPFLIAYADNLTSTNLSALISTHEQRRPVLTVGLFEADEPWRCGIADLDDRQIITGFEEKPPRPRSSLANAGLYVADGALFEHLPDQTPCDFGRDVLPRLVGRMVGERLSAPLLDIGTAASYALAHAAAARTGLFESEVAS